MLAMAALPKSVRFSTLALFDGATLPPHGKLKRKRDLS
jgi:hypothetical protein